MHFTYPYKAEHSNDGWRVVDAYGVIVCEAEDESAATTIASYSNRRWLSSTFHTLV